MKQHEIYKEMTPAEKLVATAADLHMVVDEPIHARMYPQAPD
jgi:hypothetical protein